MKTPRLLVGMLAFAMAALSGVAALQSAQLLPDRLNPRFPNSLLIQGITRGRAHVAVSIDASGKVRDTLVLAYTHPRLAATSVEAVKSWQFAPARLDGEPVPVQTVLSFDYTVEGAVISTNIVNHFLFDGFDNVGDNALAYRPGEIARLDRAPQRVSGDTPRYAEQALKDGVQGTVAVQFYIDETGAVRLPAVTSGNNPYLMEQAVAAVKTWKFEPPQSRGSPVLIAARQEFRFGGNP